MKAETFAKAITEFTGISPEDRKKNACFIRGLHQEGFLLCGEFLPENMEQYNRTSLLLWSGKKKEMTVIDLDVKKVQSGILEADLEAFFESYEPEEETLRFWLLTEGEGGCQLYWMEEERNRGLGRNHEDHRVKIWKKEKEKGDDRERFLAPRFLGEMAVFVRYSQDWQLCLQCVKKENTYSNRYFPIAKKIYEKSGRLVICLKSHKEFDRYERLIMQHRDGESSYEFEKDGENEFSYPLDKIKWEPFFWDFFVNASKEEESFRLKLRNFRSGFKGQFTLVQGENRIYSFQTQNHNMIISCRPISEYDDKRYRRRERLACVLYYLGYPYWRCKDVVLLYEKFCKCAQDNALVMFQYYEEKKTRKEKKNTFYIIDKREPDYKYVEMYGRQVVDFMSVRHLLLLLAAKKIVTTDTLKHAYQWRGMNTYIFNQLLDKPIIFLQHGVLGLKKVDYIYDRSGGNAADLFITSSNAEKKIVMRKFHYYREEVPVTGLARWDAIREVSTKEKNIVCMPTWRNWMIELSEDEFLKSDYFLMYDKLLNSKELHAVLEEENLYLTFCMHPKFREFMKDYQPSSNRIRCFDYGKEPINSLLMRSCMMITDYSSSSWDMLYMKKPVLFYQFDFERYVKEQGSYLNMETELFGERVFEITELTKRIRNYAKNDFGEGEKAIALREKYLTMQDKENKSHCQRIDEAIQKFVKNVLPSKR